jgi:hypothetical protein
VVCLLSCLQLVRATRAPVLNVCLTGGVHAPGSPSFNNIRFAYVQVRRPAGDLPAVLHALADQLHDFARATAASQSAASYLGTFAYPALQRLGVVGAPVGERIDCVVSLAPTSRPATYEGGEARVDAVHFTGSQAPVYCGWYTSTQSLVCASIIRSPDIPTGYGVAWTLAEVLAAVSEPWSGA